MPAVALLMPIPQSELVRQVSELNRRGDLLMTYGYAWEYGQTHVHCEDFDTGEPVSIEIPRGPKCEHVSCDWGPH